FPYTTPFRSLPATRPRVRASARPSPPRRMRRGRRPRRPRRIGASLPLPSPWALPQQSHVAPKRSTGNDAIMCARRNVQQRRMSSWLDTALDRFERDNEDLALATHRVLARIATDAPLHARLLNTLSM